MAVACLKKGALDFFELRGGRGGGGARKRRKQSLSLSSSLSLSADLSSLPLSIWPTYPAAEEEERKREQILSLSRLFEWGTARRRKS